MDDDKDTITILCVLFVCFIILVLVAGVKTGIIKVDKTKLNASLYNVSYTDLYEEEEDVDRLLKKYNKLELKIDEVTKKAEAYEEKYN